MADYAGNASGAGVPHTTIPLVDDSSPPTAMYFNPPLEALADNDAYRAAAIAPLTAAMPHKLDGAAGGTYTPTAPILVNGAGIVRSRNGLLDVSLAGSSSNFNSSQYELYAIFGYQLFSSGSTTTFYLNGSTDPTPPSPGRTVRFTSVALAKQSGPYSIYFTDTDSAAVIAQFTMAANTVMPNWWIEFVYGAADSYIAQPARWVVSAWSSFWDGAGIELVTA